MRQVLRAGLLAAVATGILLVAACGGSVPRPTRTSPAPADLPPAWVQNEVAWQALAAGDPDPGDCHWSLGLASRAASLDGSRTSFLSTYPGESRGSAYIVVLDGHFTSEQGQPAVADAGTLYLVILSAQHYYLAHGLVSGPVDLTGLGALHSYRPALPVSAGVWGHTLGAGGPFPGGPWLLAHVSVDIWKGNSASGKPIQRVRSDANAFFSVDLPPGVYTFQLADRRRGYPISETVTVKAGQPVAAGVYASVK